MQKLLNKISLLSATGETPLHIYTLFPIALEWLWEVCTEEMEFYGRNMMAVFYLFLKLIYWLIYCSMMYAKGYFNFSCHGTGPF